MTGRDEWAAMMSWLSEQTGQWAAMARHHLVLTASLRESLAAAEAEAHDLRAHCAKHVETLEAMGAVLDVAGRVARGQSHAHDAIEVAMDCAPMRNLLRTMYGLGPIGEVLPARRKRKAVEA